MFCLLVCFEVATVIRGVIAVIADIFWWADLMSVIIVFAQVVLCVASELALVTLKTSFLLVSRHVPPQHDFPESTACFVVALVAQGHSTDIVHLGQMSTHCIWFFGFVCAHSTDDLACMVYSLVHYQFEFFILGVSACLELSNRAGKFSRGLA